jgi:hypothetical protein
MGIKLNFGDFFFAKKLFFFPEMGKIGVKTGKIPKKSKKSQKIPKNRKRHINIYRKHWCWKFLFWDLGGCPGCYFGKVFGKENHQPISQL